MRHRKKINHLGRQAGHRRAMLANMASSLILHKRISTTTAKAKALRKYVEPLITKTKNLTTVEEKTHAQRVVFSYLQDKTAVKELFSEVGPKIETRPGGYTRILKTGNRIGDNAEMCIIELVDYNQNLLKAADEAGKSSRRRRRGSKKAVETADVAEAAVAKSKKATKVEKAEVKEEVAETPAAEVLNEKPEDAESADEKKEE